MRILLTILIFCAIPTLALCQRATPAQNMEQMEWLLGNWTRTNSKPGKSGYEIWKRTSPTEWQGRGISLKGTDTTFVEKLRIAIENDRLYYIADVAENKKPVYFEVTSVTADSFTCENPAHDFPKKIFYRFDGKEVRARVSSGDQGQDFVFERSK